MNTDQLGQLQQCEYREPIHGKNRNICRFLNDLAGCGSEDLFEVAPDACAACIKWHRPTGTVLNPVVASLLYTFAESSVNRIGETSVEGLRELALEWIPNQEDYSTIHDDIQRQNNLTVSTPAELVPPPGKRHGQKVKDWAVGITTAPRDQETLTACLESVADAGWDHPRLFVDGQVSERSIPGDLPVTHRDPQIGAWPSWYLSLAELVMRHPGADVYMIIQDDVVFYRHSGLRDYLENLLWPDPKLGIVSLYCSRAYSEKEPGWKRLEEPLVWGAQALLFSPESALDFLSNPYVIRHRLTENGLTGIDSLIGRWAEANDVPIYVPNPSLVQHIGHVSSIWSDSKTYGFRRAAQFAGR